VTGTDADGGRSLVTSITMLLIGAGRIAQRRLDEALVEHGLTLRHVGALGHLARSPDLSYSDLARRAGVTVQSMHATIAGLVDRGAIAPAATGRGQRAQLRLTEHGHALLTTAATIAHRLDTQWQFDDRELTRLRTALLDAVQPTGLDRTRNGGSGR
jgi:DNA-binding MarR family transcriptional regulator